MLHAPAEFSGGWLASLVPVGSTRIDYPPEGSSIKCGSLGVFRKEYFMLNIYCTNRDRKTSLNLSNAMIYIIDIKYTILYIYVYINVAHRY